MARTWARHTIEFACGCKEYGTGKPRFMVEDHIHCIDHGMQEVVKTSYVEAINTRDNGKWVKQDDNAGP